MPKIDGPPFTDQGTYFFCYLQVRRMLLVRLKCFQIVELRVENNVRSVRTFDDVDPYAQVFHVGNLAGK